MSFATQSHTSYSQRNFPESRSDAQIKARSGPTPGRARAPTGTESIKKYSLMDEIVSVLNIASGVLPWSFRSMMLELHALLQNEPNLCRVQDRIFNRSRIIMRDLLGQRTPFATEPDCLDILLPGDFGLYNHLLDMYGIRTLCGRRSFFERFPPVLSFSVFMKMVSKDILPKRQQQPPHGDRPCCKLRRRNKVRKEPSGSSKVPIVENIELDVAGNLEQHLLPPLRIETKVEWRTAHGRSSLKKWRRAAGKSKSWKPYPKMKEPKHTRRNGRRRSSNGTEYRSIKPLLWLPATFLRSQKKEKPSWSGRISRPREIDSVPRQSRYHDSCNHNFEDTPIAPHGKYHTTASWNVQTRGSKPEIFEDINEEPAGAFIRFTWKDKILTNGTGQLDRFLSASSILHSYWHVTSFLRNESFADVYSLSKPPFTPSSAEPEASLEAHVFLDEYHGNCAVYASRSKNRMRQSGNCLDTFWHNGRHVFIMKIPKKPTLFKLRNSEEEFPVLVDQNKCNEQVALQRRRFRSRPSFAAMAGGGWPNANSEFRPVQMDERKSPLEKELERIEKARMKKAERQRVKRKLQREERLMKKECRSAIATAFMVVHE
ncbi:hypothetical protein J3E71DRAFT_373735 [Bipolaris maydis]|nr:hypothetical protein J3E71DRAFT_373735 [Bipolaris maydis]